ncbi:MAG: nucleotidyltransferase domain-containing protein [Marinilabiliaceae bacterium]|nr:nucleotidyltransferase domain-containing protein [Marinilabiliaceae bacterium]
MDKREIIIEKVRIYKNLVEKQFPLNIAQFWLFGSFAKGNPHKDSDIDIALVVEHLDNDFNYLETEPILWKLCKSVDFRMEPHLIAQDTDYAGMLDEIKNTGILIA